MIIFKVDTTGDTYSLTKHETRDGYWCHDWPASAEKGRYWPADKVQEAFDGGSWINITRDIAITSRLKRMAL